jgi:valyl-tRNA synthetase
MAILQELIIAIRNMRAELKVVPKVKTPIRVHTDAATQKLVDENLGMLERLANVEGMEFMAESLAHASGARTSTRFEVALVYERQVDKAAESERLKKELAKQGGQLAGSERQLGNEQFLAKAPPHVVEGLKKQVTELKILIEKNKRALEALK